MRTITQTVELFRFSELSDKSKETAKEEHFSALGYSWSREAIQSLEKLAEHFGGKLADYSFDWSGCSHSWAKFSMPDDMESDEISERLERLGSYNPETLRGHGDCVLTGYCADENAIDGFRIAHHAGESDLEKLMQAAFWSLLKSCQNDYESEQSDEVFGDTCEANDYEFTADGTLYAY